MTAIHKMNPFFMRGEDSQLRIDVFHSFCKCIGPETRACWLWKQTNIDNLGCRVLFEYHVQNMTNPASRHRLQWVGHAPLHHVACRHIAMGQLVI